jgi:hypothetical protein
MTTLPEEIDYDRAAWRIGRNMAVIAAVGTAFAFLKGGWKWGAGFLLGAAISGLNYRWLRRLVEALGGQRQPTKRRRNILLVLRYLILAAGAYAIIRFSSISPPAVVLGLFVLTAAVFVETVFEIVYARK